MFSMVVGLLQFGFCLWHCWFGTVQVRHKCGSYTASTCFCVLDFAVVTALGQKPTIWLLLVNFTCLCMCVSVCQCESVWVRSSDLVHLMVRLEFTNRVCYWIHSSQCSRGFTVGFWEFYAADKCLFHLVVKYKSSRVSSVEFISVLFFLSVNELTEALFSLRQ